MLSIYERKTKQEKSLHLFFFHSISLPIFLVFIFFAHRLRLRAIEVMQQQQQHINKIKPENKQYMFFGAHYFTVHKVPNTKQHIDIQSEHMKRAIQSWHGIGKERSEGTFHFASRKISQRKIKLFRLPSVLVLKMIKQVENTASVLIKENFSLSIAASHTFWRVSEKGKPAESIEKYYKMQEMRIAGELTPCWKSQK